MADDLLKELRERKAYADAEWSDIRTEGEQDMKYVGGDPWTADDKKQRKNRPTIAPEEMSQYFNQVINSLWSNPRGIKFAPTGNGANDRGAEFYQDKTREIEYRSHAKIAYVTAAENAIQRSYGYVRVNTGYASPRTRNQELSIEALPDPDLVTLDPDAKRPDSSDMGYAFVAAWSEQGEFKRRNNPSIRNIHDFAKSHPGWVSGDKVLEAEYWTISTRKRKLLLVQPPAMHGQAPPRQIAPVPVAPVAPLELFADEFDRASGMQVLRELREVDYPSVKQYLTNGLEMLGDATDWPGKYIPIVSCYGKVIWVPQGGQTKRKILSMTRFGRDPWKAFCYACSQELEIIAQVPKASVLAAAGQLKGFEKDWEESPHIPKAFLLYHALTEETGPNVLPAPQRLAYLQGENLQALEIVKEGFRRSIQSAMGSNFLPTQAQRRNEKSGKALDKMEQSAAQGTFHFVNSYEDMIRRVGIICEDLIDKIHDYRGETGIMKADNKAQIVAINDPANKEAYSTKGDYLCTVSTAPNSDSQREAADDFTDTLVGNLQMIAAISGPKAAAAVLARSIKMRNLGPQGDQLAELIEPPEYKTKDGQPPDPEKMALQQENQQLKGVLQQAAQEKQAKVVELKGKYAIEQMKVEATSMDKAADREVKLAVAELSAKLDKMALFMEESQLIGARAHEAAQSAHDRVHQTIESAKDRAHDRLTGAAQHQQGLIEGEVVHQQALEKGDVAHQQGLEATAQEAALAPEPAAGA